MSDPELLTVSIGPIDNTMANPGMATKALSKRGPSPVFRLPPAAATDQRDLPELRQTVRDESRKLVGSLFVLPLMKQMQDDPFKTDLFHGGFAEDAFQSRLNTVLSDRLVTKLDEGFDASVPAGQGRRGWSVVDMVYRHHMARYERGGADRSTPRVDTHG